MKTAFALALVMPATAQVAFEEGKPSLGMTPLNKAWRPAPTFSLPALNTSRIMAWREAMGHGLKVGGFAVPQEVSINAAKDGDWVDGGVWRYTFQAHDKITKGMYVMFDEFEIPVGATLYAYTEKGNVAGPFTAKNNKVDGAFMIRPLEGQTITVEYDANGIKEEPKLSINMIGSAYAAFPGYKGDALEKGPSGYCNVNSACPEADGWRDELRAGAILMGGFSGGYCSGSMINNEEGKQYFLTAYHCSPSASDVVGFNYAEATCDGDSNGINPDTAQGLKTIAKSAGSDFHLLEVEESIPSSYNVYMSAWNAEDTSSWTDVTGIHHPSADRQKFSQHTGGVTRSGYLGASGETHWYVTSWELGTTEGGSSGSPLYNANKQIIGQLHGGYASCTYNYDDYYGSTAVSYKNGLGAALSPSGKKEMPGTNL